MAFRIGASREQPSKGDAISKAGSGLASAASGFGSALGERKKRKKVKQVAQTGANYAAAATASVFGGLSRRGGK